METFIIVFGAVAILAIAIAVVAYIIERRNVQRKAKNCKTWKVEDDCYSNWQDGIW